MIISSLLISNSLNAQLINCNPDLNDAPWYGGGLSLVDERIQGRVDSVSKFILSNASKETNLDYAVDNSTKIYMPEILYQGNQGICAQVAVVSYMFTYEINRSRNVSASAPENRYHPSFTYNFLNYGKADTVSYFDEGLYILKEMGCMDSATYERPIPNPDYTEWISGYEKYYTAMQNRVSDYETIDILADSGLFYLKHWLNDHNCADSVGGLAVFGLMNFDSIGYGTISQGPQTGKSIMISFSDKDTNTHALTLVGYNDSIRYDYNSDNIIEEWEYGAFKAANSHGITYPPNGYGGYVYVPYHMITDSSFLNGYDAFICNVVDYQPQVTVKAKMSHPNRYHFGNQLGSDTLAGNSTPFYKEALGIISNRKAGTCELTGCNSNNDTLEIAIDFSYLLDTVPDRNLGKLFFRPFTKNSLYDQGMLWYGSMIDNRWGETFELPFSNLPDSMKYLEHWDFSVDYDLLPFVI